MRTLNFFKTINHNALKLYKFQVSSIYCVPAIMIMAQPGSAFGLGRCINGYKDDRAIKKCLQILNQLNTNKNTNTNDHFKSTTNL